jgi:hypothetical protein
MKKLILSVITTVGICCIAAVCANAAVGDVIGKVYSTDIIAEVNGNSIISYNIGGQTAICIEDLDSTNSNYGFMYEYDDETRTLTVQSTGNSGNNETELERGEVEKITGDIYDTDIKVIFNGEEIKGYNIGGRTAVTIEDLGTLDESSPNYEFGYSKYLCNFKWNPEERRISLYTYQTDDATLNDNRFHQVEFIYNDNRLSCSFDQMNDYFGICTENYSEEFENEKYVIKPVYMDDDIVGSMYRGSSYVTYRQLDKDRIYEKIKDKIVVLSYDEAKKFIEDNYEIIETDEDDNAKVYLVKNSEGIRYVMFAIKSGGFVCYMEIENQDASVSLDESYVVIYPYGGPHGAVTAHLGYDTGIYKF